MFQLISRVPVNIITGFLGVGKTTAILHLLKNKPKEERWAVLVNEFGEIGVDGAIFSSAVEPCDEIPDESDTKKKPSVLIKEIPGGCMCCVNGVPTKVGLNALLKDKPDRLLIEPTGLGHPNEVIELLTGKDYESVVELQSTITLVDPKKLRDDRYQSHEIYRTQLSVADYLVATKGDQCDVRYRDDFDSWFDDLMYQGKVKKGCSKEWVSLGQLEFNWLANKPVSLAMKDHRSSSVNKNIHQAHLHSKSQFLSQLEIIERDNIDSDIVRRKENKGEGFFSCGWVFPSFYEFDESKLQACFLTLSVERIKGVFNLKGGRSIVINAERNALSFNDVNKSKDSRVEVIHSEPLDWLEVERLIFGTIID